MTAGNAEQLVSTVGIEDRVPYNFRTTGGSADVGDRVKLSEITGGTVAWNQLIENGNFVNTNCWVGENANFTVNNNVATAVKTTPNGDVVYYKGIRHTEGHKYLKTITVKTTAGLTFGFNGEFEGFDANGNWQTKTIIYNSPSTSNHYLLVRNSGVSDFQPFYVKNIMYLDLTVMFGSTIADYIYSLEQNTAGAGVAWFRKLFPKDYYAYDAGNLLSVQTSAHKTVGFNQWDEEWEVGTIDVGTGQNATNGNYFRSKNYIPVVSNNSYYFKANGDLIYIFYYDAGRNYLTYSTTTGGIISITSNVAYIRFVNTSRNTYNHDICINLHWDGERDGEYEPYEANTYVLDDVELRGIPKLDANNNLYYDGDSYKSDGTVNRRYGIVDLGTLDWAKTSSSVGANRRFQSNGIISIVKKSPNASTVPNIICAGYKAVTVNQAWTEHDGITIETGGTTTVMDSTKLDMSVTDFKSSMSGVYLVYELATPTTESADPYQETQICNDFGTEEFVDSRTVPMPVGYSAFYQANLRAKLEMAPDSPSGNGDYIVRQTNGLNEYVPLVIPTELPTNPSEDGTYTLKCAVADGTATISWVADA